MEMAELESGEIYTGGRIAREREKNKSRSIRTTSHQITEKW